MKAVIAVARAPHFSVRKPFSYQAAVAFSLPQPSTLAGALAFSLAARGRAGSGSGDSYIEEYCRTVLKGLVRATVKPLSPLTRSTLTITRARVLELKSSEEIARKIKEGKKITDAMIREYIHGVLGLVYVFKNPDEASAALKSLYLVERLGDTESCVYVSVVEEAELEKVGKRGFIDTYTPREWVEKVIGGSFSLEYMYPEELACKVLRSKEDLKNAIEYIIPVYEEKESLIAPSAYEAEVKNGFCIWRIKARSFEANIVLPEVVRNERV